MEKGDAERKIKMDWAKKKQRQNKKEEVVSLGDLQQGVVQGWPKVNFRKISVRKHDLRSISTV